MRQWLRSHLTYPNVMVTILAFIVLGGTTYAATGDPFILGKPNSASSTTSLSAPVSGKKALQVTNTSAGVGATALGLNVASGHPPFTVNSGTKVANLNADKLDGLDSTSLISGSTLRRVGPVAVSPGSGTIGRVTIATVGHFTFSGDCGVNLGGVDQLRTVVSGDAYGWMFGSTGPAGDYAAAAQDEGSGQGVANRGAFTTGTPVFDPISGTALNSSPIQQVTFDLYQAMNVDDPSLGPGTCIWGGTIVVK